MSLDVQQTDLASETAWTPAGLRSACTRGLTISRVVWSDHDCLRLVIGARGYQVYCPVVALPRNSTMWLTSAVVAIGRFPTNVQRSESARPISKSCSDDVVISYCLAPLSGLGALSRCVVTTMVARYVIWRYLSPEPLGNSEGLPSQTLLFLDQGGGLGRKATSTDAGRTPVSAGHCDVVAHPGPLTRYSCVLRLIESCYCTHKTMSTAAETRAQLHLDAMVVMLVDSMYLM